MDELVVRNAKKIDENTPIPKITEDNVFELFQLQTVADLRLMSRNFMRLSLFLDDIYDKFENKYVKNTDLAEDNRAGIVTLDKIREVAPKPDLSPYVRGDNSYIYKDNNYLLSRHDKFIRCNNSDVWTPQHLHMYANDDVNQYQGTFHLNGGRAYYKVPNRNGGNWCEIMDNHDMAARDNRINGVESRANDAWNRTQDLYNLRNTDNNDKWQNYVREIRLAGYIIAPVWSGNQLQERGGYVITGFVNSDGDIGGGDYGQMRVIQFYRNGSWLNTYFA